MIKRFAGTPIGREYPVVIMGVLNISPETFYMESIRENPGEAVRYAEELVENGADIIDLGAMSTAPNAKSITVEDEENRIMKVIELLSDKINAPISIDTQRASVARSAIESGAEIVNDVSGLKSDPEMVDILAEYETPAILMASNRKPGDVKDISSIKKALQESLNICKKSGVDLEEIAIDPGIGFGKDKKWDLNILRNLSEFKEFDNPICIGVSRKSFIGETLGLKYPEDRLWGSLGATAVAVMDGVDMIRTHDPRETSHIIRMIEAIVKEIKI